MAKKVGPKKKPVLKKAPKKQAALRPMPLPLPSPMPQAPGPAVLDRLWGVVSSRRSADPNVSHSARLLARGTDKVAQKFGEEAVECLIEAVAGNRAALITESADVLYHLIVMWVNAGVRAEEVWAELERREGVSGIAERAARAASRLPMRFGVRTRKIP
ncbi:MAG: phosphoribosyl-ATP diphosphatase [Alphaproteobacteria bacterium]|nr:phosphoribosyl-ATP diphosphatase [Alphaproteobacteria bacterium]